MNQLNIVSIIIIIITNKIHDTLSIQKLLFITTQVTQSKLTQLSDDYLSNSKNTHTDRQTDRQTDTSSVHCSGHQTYETDRSKLHNITLITVFILKLHTFLSIPQTCRRGVLGKLYNVLSCTQLVHSCTNFNFFQFPKV